jgi:hypothetical protein
MMTIQLCCTHLFLDDTICQAKTAMHPDSQLEVYKCYADRPLLGKGLQVNVPWLLNIATFFKYHLHMVGEGILHHAFSQLETHERPTPWTGSVMPGVQKLGRRWKGAYTYLEDDEVVQIRKRTVASDDEEAVIDSTQEGNDGFEDLSMFFDLEDQPGAEDIEGLGHGPWINDILDESLPDHILSIKDDIYLDEHVNFFGLGQSHVKFHVHGRIQALPPQSGVPGFQRFTMLKYLPDAGGMYGLGTTQFWAYEGSVLPGNNIILGRYV